MPKAPKKKTSTTATDTNGRTVLYPEVTLSLCDDSKPLTVDQAKDLLGWEEETEDAPYGSDYLLRNHHGTKIRCYNNVTNRPLYGGVVQMLKQEHLRQRWQMNGEPVIIGSTGLVLNGQHTLISFILAAEAWQEAPEDWPGHTQQPTMVKLVVYGISEEDHVINTMDTCKPRSLADVIYRSNHFANMPSVARRKVARITDYAVRLLWSRTGMGLSAHAPRRTHAEALDFIARHPKLLDCVQHVYQEDGGDKQLSRYLSLGYMAGMLYLMGSSGTDPAEYRAASNPSEDLLDFAQWEDACDFLVWLAGSDNQLKAVRVALAHMVDDGGGSVPERTGLLAKAWNQYATGKAVTAKHLVLDYHTDPDGFRTLAETADVGGIDLGDPAEVAAANDPSLEEIATRAAAERAKAEAKKAGGRGKKKAKPSKAKDPIPGTWTWEGELAGVRVLVDDPNTKPWKGILQDTYQGPAGTVAQVEDNETGNTYDVPLDCLRPE